MSGSGGTEPAHSFTYFTNFNVYTLCARFLGYYLLFVDVADDKAYTGFCPTLHHLRCFGYEITTFDRDLSEAIQLVTGIGTGEGDVAAYLDGYTHSSI